LKFAGNNFLGVNEEFRDRDSAFAGHPTSMNADRSFLIWPGVPLALASAALFGASTPFAKLLIGSIDAWLLAGFLYLASGLGLALVLAFRRVLGLAAREAPLRRRDLPWLVGIVVFGGGVGPVLLMLGLVTTSASAASLLLNLEGLATMAIAWVVFRENADWRILAGAGAILAGAMVLTWPSDAIGIDWGAAAIAGACLAWGIDNNLTRKLSAADPVQIAAVKGIAAGSVNLALALGRGAALPAMGETAAAAVVGFLGYGVSIVLFVFALRHLGAARTGAYFSTAPFIGAVVALALFTEPITARFAVAGLLMGIGVWLHLTERHEHKHTHGVIEHEHRHVHDEHHRHDHAPDDPPGEPHTHWHRHGPLAHAHLHYPDLHHRHEH
jgi:drug/metabolite transporter (DMT)-like permease